MNESVLTTDLMDDGQGLFDNPLNGVEGTEKTWSSGLGGLTVTLLELSQNISGGGMDIAGSSLESSSVFEWVSGNWEVYSGVTLVEGIDVGGVWKGVGVPWGPLAPGYMEYKVSG